MLWRPCGRPLDARGHRFCGSRMTRDRRAFDLPRSCRACIWPFGKKFEFPGGWGGPRSSSGHKPTTSRVPQHAKHRPSSPRPHNDPRRSIAHSSTPMPWRNGFRRTASPARSITGRQGRRHLQDVVPQFHHRQEPFFRRRVPRTRARRTSPLHRQVRRPEPAGRNRK